MARDVVIQLTCDGEKCEGEKTPANSYSMDLGTGPYEIELCAPCHLDLVEALELVLEIRGRRITKAAFSKEGQKQIVDASRKTKSNNSGSNSKRSYKGRKPSPPKECPVPNCMHETSGAGYQSHLRWHQRKGDLDASGKVYT